MKIIIIGASSGIGKEMTLLYAQEGHTVGITGRRKALLKEVRLAYPDKIFTSSFDVTATESLAHFQKLVTTLGGLDLLIYNAGIGQPSDALNPEFERITTQTNVLGFVEIVSFAFTFFVQQGYG